MAKRAYTPGTGALRGFLARRQRFVDGEDSPREFLERCIRRIRKRDNRLRAFVALDLKGARRAADRSSRRYREGAPRSLLDGCPVAVKDIIHTLGLPTGMGSPLYRGWQAPVDAACVAALREAGAVVVGKSHTTEFAVGESPPTTNPWKRSRTPGGSSSGSAAAVGAGLLPLALGTQTVGSILRPASFCGAVGYKPSLGAIPVSGVHPLSRTLDHVGPIAASVEDAWAAATLMQRAYGAEAMLDTAWFEPVEPAAPHRLARIDHLLGTDEREPGAQQAFDAFISRLQGAGVEIVAVEHGGELAQLLGESNAICADILRFEMRYPLELYLRQQPDAVGPRIKEHLHLGREVDLDRYRSRLAQRARLRELVAEFETDGFVLPAASGPAPRGLAFTGSRTMLAPWSAVGGPAWSLPLLQVDGLPLGVQLAGAPGHDTPLASLAHWMEHVHE